MKLLMESIVTQTLKVILTFIISRAYHSKETVLIPENAVIFA